MFLPPNLRCGVATALTPVSTEDVFPVTNQRGEIGDCGESLWARSVGVCSS